MLDEQTIRSLPSWYEQLPHGGYPLALSADFKRQSDDFQIDEVLAFEPAGDGEHVFLYIEKQSLNTIHVAELIAQLAGVHIRDIGYSGLKDKHAVARQWFSIYLPTNHREQPDWQLLERTALSSGQAIKIVRTTLHNKKLKRGTHRYNEFQVRLRNLQVTDKHNCSLDWQQALNQKLQASQLQGFPNYFGYQRFGYQFRNIEHALRWLESGARISKTKKSLYLSSLRSFLFNEYLATRVGCESWNHPQAGERLQINGKNSYFYFADDLADSERHDIFERLNNGHLHLSGILPGSDWDSFCTQNERDVFARHKAIIDKLARHVETSAVRPLRAFANDLVWQFSQGNVQLSFRLQRGEFATAFLREIVQLNDVSQILKEKLPCP